MDLTDVQLQQYLPALLEKWRNRKMQRMYRNVCAIGTGGQKNEHTEGCIISRTGPLVTHSGPRNLDCLKEWSLLSKSNRTVT